MLYVVKIDKIILRHTNNKLYIWYILLNNKDGNNDILYMWCTKTTSFLLFITMYSTLFSNGVKNNFCTLIQKCLISILFL